MRFPKKLLALLTAAALACALGLPALAHEAPDLTKTGSIRVTMRAGDLLVTGGSLTLYRAGEIWEDDGNYSFVPIGDFAGCGEELTDVSSPELAQRLADYASANNLTGMTRPVDEDGMVSFPALELGLYLLVQQEAAAGYGKAAPFLVSVPYWEDGTYLYDVDASPKVALEREPEPTEPTKPAEPTLPQTGQLNWPVPVLTAAGLCLFAAGWALYFGKRKDGHEE